MGGWIRETVTAVGEKGHKKNPKEPRAKCLLRLYTRVSIRSLALQHRNGEAVNGGSKREGGREGGREHIT